MHRIDTSTAQVDKFGSGKNGFTGGNPQTGVLPTALDADYFDTLQEELAGVIEAAGITLKKDTNTQLLTAMRALFTGRQIGAPIVMTSTGTYTPSSAAVKFVEVELYAPGGGSSGVPAYSGGTASIAGGASAGTWVRFRIPVSLISSGVLVTIGVPGAAGSSGGGIGGAGGNSSFGSLVVCPGGLGSGYSSATSAINAGGANSPADATISSSVTVVAKSRGQAGSPGYLSNNTSGSPGLGGASPVGSSGADSVGNGSGGSGVRSTSGDTAAKSGIAGGPGLCIIREMA
ncbi:MAG: hypothetical protein E6Z83_06255 [Pantoea sp.]|uniref:hypothetical protein n=1 Tax=Pantoea TaxID=53335 RepID=UPI00117D3F0D|nr:MULTISPECIES: hypothetical protein [Pantoea]MDU5780392.1 hypothetical protein [Pantoea sp.]